MLNVIKNQTIFPDYIKLIISKDLANKINELVSEYKLDVSEAVIYSLVENKNIKSTRRNSLKTSFRNSQIENLIKSSNIITFNKGVGLGDLFTKKNSARQLDISTKGDLVSALGVTQNANKEIIDNRFKSKDPFKNALNAHKTDNLFGPREQPDQTDIIFPEAKN